MPLNNQTKHFCEEVIDYGDDISYEDLIDKINTAHNELLQKGVPADKISFEIEYESGLHIFGSRQETPIEELERLQAAAQAQAAANERELAQYQILKAKFETPPVELP